MPANNCLQNFHTKAALMICSSRAQLPQAYNKNGELRQNRWVSLSSQLFVCLKHFHCWI